MFLCSDKQTCAMECCRKNFIFDLGGVLLDIEPARTFDAFAALGVGREVLSEAFALSNSTMLAFESGKISAAELFAYIAGLLPAEKRALPAAELERALCDAWCALLGNFPPCKWQHLRALRARGHKVFLLSNTNALHWEVITRGIENLEGLALSDYFDGVFLSYEMGLCKPAPRIFEMLVERAGIAPGNKIFFDDSQANCDAARSVGIEAVVLERNSAWETII